MTYYSITFSVPFDEWEIVKMHILTTNFLSDNPEFTRHRPQNGREYATFTTDIKRDIDTITAILPTSAYFYND